MCLEKSYYLGKGKHSYITYIFIDSTAYGSTRESERSYANDSEHKEERRAKATQALVCEFTYMPTKTFRLREGGLVLTPYALYRLRKSIFN